MERLWAPWRMEYIQEHLQDACIFCAKPAQGRDEENHILYRGEHAYLMLNLYPYNNGHLMIAPYRHLADLLELRPEESAAILYCTRIAVEALRHALHPDGFNIGLNLGRVAGAGISDHLHAHIVPRWSGDCNFMPVLANTKVIPELLDRTFGRLRESLVALNYLKGG